MIDENGNESKTIYEAVLLEEVAELKAVNKELVEALERVLYAIPFRVPGDYTCEPLTRAYKALEKANG